MSDDSTDLDAAAASLYSVVPAEFVTARDARVKAARAGGDTELAARVKALRRPSAAAWLVNLLAQSAGGLDELGELAVRLRKAQTNLDAATMKELGQERARVVAGLVGRAVTLAKDADPQFRDSQSVREQVGATLVAAVADPGAEAAVTSGRLVSPLSYAGFGEVDLTDAVATPLRSVKQQEPPEAEPEPPAERIDRRARRKALVALERAEERLDDAEEAYAEARASRHRARLEVERAQHALDELEDP